MQRRFLVAAFGDAGHAFPAIALARALARRGNEVVVETWERWREPVEAEGLAFTAAEEYKTFPPPPPGSEDGPSAADAALALLPFIEEMRPDVLVSDILTAAPALAAERAGVRRATLIPHVYPVHEPGMPFFAFGARPPRTVVGRGLWKAALPVLVGGLRRGRREGNEMREAVGLAPIERFHGGISEELALVATFPQLEYPRRWPPGTHVTGPLFFELDAEPVEIPEGPGPLVVVAPSTAQDPECRLLRVALEGLGELPVRVLATTNRHEPDEPIAVPDNAVLTEWLPYSQAMPKADLVISHGGHGTVVRALSYGVPVLCCPAVGDMAENGARVTWSGTGLSVPRRLLSPGRVSLAARRILSGSGFRRRAGEIREWSARHDGAAQAAELVEEAARESRAAKGRRQPARA